MPSVKIVRAAQEEEAPENALEEAPEEVAPGGGETLYWQETPVFQTGDYTFSAYVKGEGLTGGGAFARLKVGEAAYESVAVTGSTAESSAGRTPRAGSACR